MAWISLGPCTPRVRVSSMSAVRLGPVMKLITAPRSGGAGPSCQASSTRPSCSSDSTSAVRSKTATWQGGSSEVERGRPAAETSTSVPVSAMARSAPVTPRSASAISARSRRRSASGGTARGIDSTVMPAAPSAGAIATRRSSAGHATSRCAARSRQIRSSSPGTSAALGTRWNTPATRSNSARNRASVWGQRSLSSRRKSSSRCRGSAGRSAGDAGKSPRVLAISPRMRARNSALELRPALLERARGHGRQVARLRPPAEEERQGPDAALSNEWTLQDAADAGPEAIERGMHQQARERPEQDTLGPRRDVLLVDLAAELDQHPGNVDADGAGVGARAAERRGVRQLLHRAGAVEHRGQEDADRTRIRVAVRVAADLPVDGAHVEARAAAQAVERLPERAGDLRDAAVVEQDQVELVGSFQLAGPSRSLHERRVDGELLAGRTLGENGQEYGEVRHGRDDLF